MRTVWDYLILTAGNARQAEAYERQVRARPEAAETLVVPDTDGRRIGSGGSTLLCLIEILNREPGGICDFEHAYGVLRKKRILVLHAGGDSRRLPAYSACGKIFVPLPAATPCTLFDCLVATFAALPRSPEGQMVVASGDALILFDPSPVDFARPGLTALGAEASPEEAARHGVFCGRPGEAVRLYLQKPSIEEQRATGALGPNGRTMLDVGVMGFSAEASAGLLRAFARIENGRIALRPEIESAMLDYGLDLYREICCAMGTETTCGQYIRGARESGSKWPEGALSALFPTLHSISLHLEVLRRCRFLHFGSTRQLITSGLSLMAEDRGCAPASTAIALGNDIEPGGRIDGCDAWIEGCRIAAPLSLSGDNVVVGIDVSQPLSLPRGACVDVSHGRRGWFTRCYGIDDTFKHPLGAGATLCGIPLETWLAQAGLDPGEVWDAPDQRTLWNARLFPAESARDGYRRWLWMFDPASATAEEKLALHDAVRYSTAEIAVLAEAFEPRGQP